MFTSATRQIGGSLVVSLIHLLAGSSIPLSSIIIPDLEMSKDEISWFASIITLGIILGSVAGCVYCDIIGWRTSLIIDCFGYLAGFLIIIFINSVLETYWYFLFDYVVILWIYTSTVHLNAHQPLFNKYQKFDNK